jgi:hypothetical protein
VFKLQPPSNLNTAMVSNQNPNGCTNSSSPLQM